MGNFRQGKYTILNESKYLGNIKEVRYLSSWELIFYKEMDANPNIISWASESVIIPYFSSADQKQRRYIIDVYIKYRDKSGGVKEELIEIKPFAQTQPPKKTKGGKKSTYAKQLYTFQVNMDKWKAATKYATDRKMKFRIVTERDLFR